MKTTVLKSRTRYTVPQVDGWRGAYSYKAKEKTIQEILDNVYLSLEDEDIQPGDHLIVDLRVKIEEAPICEDKQQKLFETQS